ncbi:uncharacterized protein [Amphiura filiformis]|uniref:uncharacterized protein n=1 Tax=Amphiura filiformis TaxID=82378 RepID=UPI003B20D438
MSLRQLSAFVVFVVCLVLCSVQPGLSAVDKIIVPSNNRIPEVSHDAAGGPETCTCSSEDVGKLTPLQKLQVELNTYDLPTEIDELEEWLKDPANQKPIVTLTSGQKQKIQKNFGETFKSKVEMEDSLKISEEADVDNKAPTSIKPGSSRKKRDSGARVCPAVESYEALVLAIDSNNRLVQVVQIPEEDAEQWFLQESCQHASSPVTVATCANTDRLVNAYIIHLATGNMQYGNIKVHSCVGYV